MLSYCTHRIADVKYYYRLPRRYHDSGVILHNVHSMSVMILRIKFICNFSNQPYLSRCSKAIEHLFGYCGILYLYIYDTDKDSRASINGLHTNLVSGASVLTLKVIYACVYVSWVHVVNPKGLSCVSNITSMLVCTFISLKQSVISRVNTPNTVM